MISDVQIANAGKELGEKYPPDITRFWFGKLDIGTFFDFLERRSRYSGDAHYESESRGRTHRINLQHELGPRNGIFLANYIDQTIRKIVGVAPKIERGNNYVQIYFEELVF